MNILPELHVKKLFIILITLFVTVNITHAQIQFCNEGYPNCEDGYDICRGPGNTCVPWGPIEIKSFPMAALPNLVLPCGALPGCVMKIAIRKRICNGRIQMKVLGMKLEGCNANGCTCIDYFKRDPMSFMWYAYGPPFINNAFNLFQSVPFDWVDVDIFSYTCYGIYKDGISCSNLFIIPCKEFACCIYSLRIHSADCSTKGFVAGWMDESKKKGYMDGKDYCDVCRWGSNHIPTDPCTGASETTNILDSLGTTFNYFTNNSNEMFNTCVYTCHDLDTYFKTWYFKDGDIYTTKNHKRRLRFKK